VGASNTIRRSSWRRVGESVLRARHTFRYQESRHTARHEHTETRVAARLWASREAVHSSSATNMTTPTASTSSDPAGTQFSRHRNDPPYNIVHVHSKQPIDRAKLCIAQRQSLIPTPPIQQSKHTKYTSLISHQGPHMPVILNIIVSARIALPALPKLQFSAIYISIRFAILAAAFALPRVFTFGDALEAPGASTPPISTSRLGAAVPLFAAAVRFVVAVVLRF